MIQCFDKLRQVAAPIDAVDLANKGYVDTKAPIASPTFTGTPKAPTPAVGSNDTSVATTAFVKTQIGSHTHTIAQVTNLQSTLDAKAPLNNPVFTGTASAVTLGKANDTDRLATTAHVKLVVADYAKVASPALTGSPTAPTQATTDNSNKLATTAFVKSVTSGTFPIPIPGTGTALGSWRGFRTIRVDDASPPQHTWTLPVNGTWAYWCVDKDPILVGGIESWNVMGVAAGGTEIKGPIRTYDPHLSGFCWRIA